MKDYFILKDFNSKYSSNHRLKIKFRVAVVPCPMTWALAHENCCSFQGTTLPDKFSHVWLNATPWPLTQLRNTSYSWRTFFKPWLSSFLSLEDNHLIAFNYIPLGNFVYILIIYSIGSPMIMEKCLITLSSYAYGLLMLMVTKCLPIEESEWYFDLLQWGDTQSSADTDLCPVKSISIPLFMAEVPYLCISFTVTDRFLTSSSIWGGIILVVGGQGAWVVALSFIAYLAVSIYLLHASGTPPHESKKNVFRYCQMSIRRQKCLLFIIMELKESFHKKENSRLFQSRIYLLWRSTCFLIPVLTL